MASGTGIFTRLLLENGNRVYGVEPNAGHAPRRRGISARYSQFTSVAGTAEATTSRRPLLSTWSRPPRRRTGLIARRRGESSFASSGRRRGPCCCGTSGAPDQHHSSATTRICWSSTAPTTRKCAPSAPPRRLKHFLRPRDFRRATFDYHQDFDYPALEGRLLSSSYTPQAGDAGHMPMLRELRRIFDAHQVNGDQVRVRHPGVLRAVDLSCRLRH